MSYRMPLCSVSAALIAISTSVYAECIQPEISGTQLTADLHQAIANREPEIVREVLSQGANPDWAAPGLMDTVFSAASRTPLLEALNLVEAQIVFDLLNASADPNLSFWGYDLGPDSLTPLGLAINRGDEASVRFLSAFGADLASVRCTKAETALNYAANLAQPGIADFLRGHISDPTAVLAAVSAIRAETDPRSEVVFKNDQAEVLRLLTLDGFDPNSLEAREAILQAVRVRRVDLVQVLLRAGVSTEVTDSSSRLEPTLLLLSALQGDLFMVNALLSGGADANVLDTHANSALMYAAAGGNEEIVREFASRDVSTDSNLFDQTAFFFATQPTVVLALFELGLDPNVRDTLGRTALQIAVNPSPILSHPNTPVIENPVSIARALLQVGADPKITDTQGHTPLMTAARGRREERRELVSLLIASGSPVDGADMQGDTVLHHFADTGDMELVSELIAQGAAASEQDAMGRTALHRILLSDEIASERFVALVAEGLAMGLPVELADHEGRSALHIVAGRFHEALGENLVRTLLNAGADPNLLSNLDATPAMEAVAANNGAVLAAIGMADETNINLASGSGMTALAIAAEAGKTGMMQSLLDLGADPATTNLEGNSPLHIALNVSQQEAAMLLIAQGGATLMTPNNMGETPLIIAARENQHDASIALLNRGANVCFADGNDKRAIDYAQRPQKLVNAIQSIRPIGDYIAAVRQYREDLREFSRRLRRELESGLERPGIPREPGPREFGTFGLASRFIDPGNGFGPPTPSLFSQTEYYSGMSLCAISLFDGINIDNEEEIECIAEGIRNQHIHQAEQRIRQNSPVTWRALWALDTAFLEIGLIGRDELPPLPFTNAPLPADYPTSSQLSEAIRVARLEGLWGTCDGHPLYLGAAHFGNVAVIDQWYGRELPLTMRDGDGRTASILAQRNGHTAAVQAIAANADSTLQRMGAGLTADAFVAAISNAGNDLDTALIFVESSVDKDEADATGLRPLMQAVRAGSAGLPILFVLLERGADANARDNDGATALHYAASTGNLEAGKLLHRYGADLIAQNANGESARQIAERNFHSGFVDWLDSL